MNRNLIIGLVALAAVGSGTYYLGYNGASADAQVAAADQSSFENDAAAILSSGVPAQVKLNNLNANLQARIAAKKARAAKVGTQVRIPPTTTVTK